MLGVILACFDELRFWIVLHFWIVIWAGMLQKVSEKKSFTDLYFNVGCFINDYPYHFLNR